jgi:uncharacterized protein (DUF433 family)/DNA-binding transcriptional MerR regulator
VDGGRWQRGTINDELVTHFAVNRDGAARIARLTRRQVDYWSKTDLVRPVVNLQMSSHRQVFLYSYAETMSLLIVAALKDKGVSVQNIRAIVDRLREQGYAQPLTQLAYAVVGGRVCFQHPDGTWEGDVRPDQIILHEVLNLEPLRARISRAGLGDPDVAGLVDRRRGVLGSKPVIAGTRIPVDTVLRYLDAGRGTNEILSAYPELTPADVAAVRANVAS